MDNIIKLLPDNVANQIAAGEVINRPSSVLKELLENSVDAGSTKIQIMIEEGGKKLIQVIDDGRGMSLQDARLSLERHSTSKIESIDDLNVLSTYGFRGEALASIVSVSQVSLKTKQSNAELGIQIDVNGSEVVNQHSIPGPNGTNIAVKNLFFNVPARKKFLKSDSTELKYILDDFFYVALAYPDIAFDFYNNGKQLFKLVSGNLSQRIAQLFGKKYQDKLLQVNQDSPSIRIEGYVGKVDIAKKRRGEQFLFLNNRFIKNHYLNHAIKSAFGALLGDTSQPFYVLNLYLDPSTIDINVHPTKQEVKFENDKIIYDIMKSAVQHSLSQFQEIPSLDFNLNKDYLPKNPSPSSDYIYQSSFSGITQKGSKAERDAWTDLYDDIAIINKEEDSPLRQSNFGLESNELNDHLDALHFLGYIITVYKSNVVLVDQFRMHYRLLFDQLLEEKEGEGITMQTQLFPLSFELDAKAYASVIQNKEQLLEAGFEVGDFGKNSIIVSSLPSVLLTNEGVETTIIEIATETQKENLANSGLQKIASLAAIQKGKSITPEESQYLLKRLFSSSNPRFAPNGKPIFQTFNKEDLQKLIG